MRKPLFLLIACLMSVAAQAQNESFETATQFVSNMGVGWNLGNTLDTTDGKRCVDVVKSETMWGQPVTKRELFVMMKQAGFGAIRVPVTWYPHMDESGKVDDVWMARVHQVVDDVIDAGLYCIINVHHDTGDGPQWLHATTSVYNAQKAKYEYLWQQIANEFKDYGQELLFESYNEMLDGYNSWCFATFARQGGYNTADANDAYTAINSYAQSFVDVVRASGGNNAKRNLVVNTYGACNGGGTWNSHLKDPLRDMQLPTDAAGSGHLIFQVHAYPSVKNLTNMRTEVNDMFKALDTHLVSKGAPVIIGEWGTANDNEVDYDVRRDNVMSFVDYFVGKAKEYGMGTFLWMGLTDGTFRDQVLFNQPDLAQRVVGAYYGDTSTYRYPSVESLGMLTCFEGEKALGWGNGITINNSAFSAFDSSVQLTLTYTVTKQSGADIQFYNGDWTQKLTVVVDGRSYNADYNPGSPYNTVRTTTFTFSQTTFDMLATKGMVIHGDGITLTKAVLTTGATGIQRVEKQQKDVWNRNGQQVYNLNGQRVEKPGRGIFIVDGKKVVAY